MIILVAGIMHTDTHFIWYLAGAKEWARTVKHYGNGDGGGYGRGGGYNY